MKFLQHDDSNAAVSIAATVWGVSCAYAAHKWDGEHSRSRKALISSDRYALFFAAFCFAMRYDRRKAFKTSFICDAVTDTMDEIFLALAKLRSLRFTIGFRPKAELS